MKMLQSQMKAWHNTNVELLLEAVGTDLSSAMK